MEWGATTPSDPKTVERLYRSMPAVLMRLPPYSNRRTGEDEARRLRRRGAWLVGLGVPTALAAGTITALLGELGRPGGFMGLLVGGVTGLFLGSGMFAYGARCLEEASTAKRRLGGAL